MQSHLYDKQRRCLQCSSNDLLRWNRELLFAMLVDFPCRHTSIAVRDLYNDRWNICRLDLQRHRDYSRYNSSCHHFRGKHGLSYTCGYKCLPGSRW